MQGAIDEQVNDFSQKLQDLLIKETQKKCKLIESKMISDMK